MSVISKTDWLLSVFVTQGERCRLEVSADKGPHQGLLKDCSSFRLKDQSLEVAAQVVRSCGQDGIVTGQRL